MTDAEKPAFGALLKGALAYWRQEVSEFTLSVWWDGCRRFELEQVSKALSRHAADPERGRFAPLLADVVRELAGTQTDRSLIAWGRVLRAMQTEGAYVSVVFDEPAIHAAIADMGGWQKVCRSEVDELPFLQKRFCESYRAYSARGCVDWPPVLIGEHQQTNQIGSRPVAPPVLIGDSEACVEVMRGPAVSLRLAREAVNRVPA